MKSLKLKIFIFLAFSSILSFAQEFPTIGEVYDYDVGDGFHYVEEAYYGGEGAWGGMNAMVILEVISKEFLEDEGILKYKFYKRSYISSSDSPAPYIDERIDSVSYSSLDQIITGSEIFENPNIYNGRLTVQNEGSSGYNYTKYRFTIGCGRTYYKYDNNYPYAWSEYEEAMVYFKKGDEEWGEALVLVGMDEEDFEASSFALFPNPVQDQLYIKSQSNREFEIHIYNSLGQLISTTIYSSSQLGIDVAHYLRGIYVAHIVDIKGITIEKRKFIKN